MSKCQDVKPAQPQRRIFPKDYTREDLIGYLVASEAENYRQAEQIEALTRRVDELEGRLSPPSGQQSTLIGLRISGMSAASRALAVWCTRGAHETHTVMCAGSPVRRDWFSKGGGRGR